jgi:hypothetical protein
MYTRFLINGIRTFPMVLFRVSRMILTFKSGFTKYIFPAEAKKRH